ncbi:MAG: tetratricopeptide repeat protein [Pseudomonadota bacterium]
MNLKAQLIAAEQNLRNRRFEEAEAICHKIIEVMPENIEAAFLLGSSHLKRLNYSESRRIFENILNRHPDHLNVNNDLGVIYLKNKEFALAEKCFRKVIEIDPFHVNALINLGNICFNFNQLESAESLYKKALALDHANGAILNNLGQILIKQNRMADWVVLMKEVFNQSIPGPEMFIAYLEAKRICQWDMLETASARIVDIIMDGKICGADITLLNLAMLSDPNIDNETLFKIVCKTADDFEKLCSSRSFGNYEKAIRALQIGQKMRIGYLSGDFCLHVCSHFLRSLINYYDRDHFEIFCYSNTLVEDNITNLYKSNVDAFIDIRNLSDLQLAARIHDDGIHILVDLSGYTFGSRISVMSYCAAPVQITYMGYPFSSGFRSIDYIISDSFLDGPLNFKYCTEKALCLPEACAAFGALFEEEINPVPPFERYGFVTFGSLLNTYKLNPIVIQVWSRILTRTPGTRLILNHPNYEPEITRQNVLKEFAKHGISAKRLHFIWEKLTDSRHLLYYNDIDIALDSFPMTGGQTTIDALWMGVPVVTWVGETHHQRGSFMMLKNLNTKVEDLVAFSQEEYIQKAVALANNPARMTELHQMIPEYLSRSILCDPQRFAGQLELAYIEAWNNKFPETRYAPEICHDTVEFVSIRGGAKIAVSGLIYERFTYILKEQQGWFDPEYDFVLEMVQPDMRVIDIVSGVGEYAIPLAKKMMEGGMVWAISTDPSHARYLLKGKNHNHLGSLQLLENFRIGNIDLDRNMMRNDWSNIHFVRINTEGVEQGLIRRGAKFFSLSSPLVMFGIKNKSQRVLSLATQFKELRYESFRLIPGLNLLVPFDPANEIDDLDEFSTHLFCCKKDRAEQLENRGLLIQKSPSAAKYPDYDASVLQQYLANLPYADGIMTHWMNISSHHKGWETYLQALSLFAVAKTKNQNASLRYACIQESFFLLRNLLKNQANVSRVLSMARVLTEMGKRALAVNVLDHLAEFLETGEGGIVMSIDEPFLSLSDQLSTMNPGDRIAEWIYASILEQRTRLRAFSSYYTGKESLKILNKIEDLGFLSGEMKRRRQLIRMRYHMEAASNVPL